MKVTPALYLVLSKGLSKVISTDKHTDPIDPSLSLSLRDPVERAEDSGAGWLGAEPDGGRGSHRGCDRQRVHLYPAHGFGLRPKCSRGMRQEGELPPPQAWECRVTVALRHLTLLSRPLPQAFTVVAVFNSMTFALKVTPLAVRSLSEGSVAVKRFQVIKYILN